MHRNRSWKLIAGPFRPTLESALEQSIRAAKADDPGAPVIVLVGSTVLDIYLRRRLARRLPLWNVRFVTFAQLARMLGRPALRRAGRDPLPPGAETLLVRDVIRRQPPAYFHPVADLPGFARTALASMADLKEAGLGPDAVAGSSSPGPRALGAIYRAHQAALDRLGLYDSLDLLAAAADAAPGDPRLAESELIAYGFYDLTGLQRRLLAAVASEAKAASVMVPAGDGPAFDYAGPLLDWLEAQGFERCGTQAGADPLVDRLFKPPAGDPLDADVRVLSVPGEPREAREVVRQVLRLAEDGVPFHEIGVLLRNPDEHARLFREAFEQRRIPTFVSGGVPLAETPAAKSMLLLTDLFAGDMSRTDVMQFAHAAPVPFAELVGGQPNLGDWELLTIDAGIVSGPEHWLPQLDALGGRPTDDEPPRAMDELPDLHRFVSALLETRRDVPGRGTWARITGWLVDAYDRFVGPCDGRERVCEVARGLADLDRTRVPATFDDLREALAERLGRDRTPAEGFQRGKVFIGGLFESRGLGFRAVIIPGLAERSFPATGRPDPILPDRQRRRLAHGGAYLPLKSARPVEERMLFALALGAATEHRTLAHSRLDVATGRDRVPSHFLIRLAEAVSGRRCDYRTLENAPGFERVSMFPSAGADRTLIDVDDRDLEMLTHLVAAGQHDRVLFLADLSPTFERGVRAEIARWQQDTFTPFDGLVPGAGRIVAAGEPIAPTRLETYLTCPFRYFLQVVLGIDELEEPEAVERIRPLERGRLVHRIFCRAYRDHFAGGGGLSADELAAALRQTADDVFRRAAPMGPALTWAIDRARIIEDLEHFARLDAEECRRAGARPALFEVRFGMPPRGPGEDEASTERPLELDLGGRTWRFKGKIDRVDELGDDGLRVIDYKTGKKRGRTNAFDGGRSLQLPLYLLAADMLRSGRRGRDARYAFATRRGGFHTVRFDRPALEDRMADLERIITTAEQSLEAGVFVCTPDSKHCRSCPFAAACGPNRELIFERKKDDPRLAPLLELAEIE